MKKNKIFNKKNEKLYLRKKYLKKRKALKSKIKNFNFDLIFKLIKKNFLKKKIIIACYYPSNSEVNILDFIENASKKNFKIVLPVTKSSGMMSFHPWKFKDPLFVSSFGILEPEYSKKKIVPDLVLTPLVVFDKDLNRIGYGGGYYDRILKKIRIINKRAIFLGIAYSFQKCSRINVNKHDFKLDYIFTEQGIISSNK
jgi:5-formyltetrahydrofolate cyclo-ligase